MEDKYKILFSGEILDGFEVESVKRSVSSLLKCTSTKVDALFSGKTFCLGKDLDKAEAKEMYTKFQKVGLKLQLKKEQVDMGNVYSQEEINSDFISTNVKDSVKDSVFKKVISTSKKSSKWEVRYFSVVKYLSFAVASIALTIALSMGLGLVGTFMEANEVEDVKIDKIEFQTLKSKLKAEEDKRYESGATVDQSQSQKELEEQQRAVEVEEKLNKYFANIEENINTYAKTLKQQSVKEFGADRLKVALDKTDDKGEPWVFWELMDEFTQDLARDANEISELEDGDYRKVDWKSAIDWAVKSYVRSINNHEQQKLQQKVKVQKALEEAEVEIMVLSIAFAVFIFFTIILALLRIERNTRESIYS